jgi:hypothetical protein
MKYAPAGLKLSDPGVQLIDANGDHGGQTSATISTASSLAAGLSGYFSIQFGVGEWDSFTDMILHQALA